MAKLESLISKPNRSPEGLAVRDDYYGRAKAERDAAGLCRLCGAAPRAEGKTRCSACTEKIRAKNVATYYGRLEAGECVACSQPRVVGKVHCPRHAKEQSERQFAKASTPEGRVRGLVIRAKARAKERGVPFDLDVKDLLPLPIVCPVLGIRLTFNGGRMKRNSPSLDRMKPELGYVRGNVRVISQRANGLKSDATSEELEAVSRYVRSIEGG
jgi:hypothetical protein